MENISRLKDKILAGGDISADEAYMLADILADASTHAEASRDIRQAAKEITSQLLTPDFDFCSIINGRSGRCSENCKWCAQSAHYNTHCETYDLVSEEECQRVAQYKADKGVHRFSLVTSGKRLQGEALDSVCRMLRNASRTGIKTCASLGLLGRDELQQLWDAGVRRYHCNLETAPSYFGSLCTTHTIEDKIRTIDTARQIGFEVCSGGIIGMGENMHQRAELALTLRRIRPASIPLNILSPIPGTPLENQPTLSEDEIVDTVALFRMIHPKVQIRFAGGRSRLSEEAQHEALLVGVNGAIVGDLLTTVGSSIDRDKERVTLAGYHYQH